MVRHGESVWNVEGRVLGQSMDVPLTDLGRRQAGAAGEHLAGLVSASDLTLVTSDQLRAVQTAEIIGARLGVRVVPEPLLREQSLGALEGRLASELRAEQTPRGQHVSEIAWGGGETIAQVWQRAVAFIEFLDPDADVVAVSHGTFLHVLLSAMTGRRHRDVDFTEPIEPGQVLARPLPVRAPVWHGGSRDAGPVRFDGTDRTVGGPR